MRAIDAALAYTSALGIRSLAVPEWKVDDKGTPLVVYWKPLTLAERESLYTNGELTLSSYVNVLVKKALDASGEKMFSLEDAPKLRTAVESSIIQRIALAILSAPKLEDVEKN